MNFRLIDCDWDKAFNEAITADHSQLRLICPFIKEGTARKLLKAGRPQLIQVITRFAERDFYNQVSDTSALRLLLENGAEIRCIKHLHSKLYLFGQRKVIVTSANLTEAAWSRNHEFGFVAEDADIVTHCRRYFEGLWDKAKSSCPTPKRLDEVDEYLNGLWAGKERAPEMPKFRDDGVDLGFEPPPVVISPITEPPQAFVKFFGEWNNRADRSMTVLSEVDRSLCQWACTYPKGKRPRQVEDEAVIFMGRMVRDPKDILIFGRATAMRHRAGQDDATPEDIKSRPWKAKWPHYIRVHHGEFLAGSLGNGVSLSELKKELRSGAFQSTKENLASGTGNTDPDHAYKQQPAVRLTKEAFDWLNFRLEEAFRRYGKLSTADLDRLEGPRFDVPADSGDEAYLHRKGLKHRARTFGFRLLRHIHNSELSEIVNGKLSPDSKRGREILAEALKRREVESQHTGKGRGYRKSGATTQNTESGSAARDWGLMMGKVIAKRLGGVPVSKNSNEMVYKGGRWVVKSAKHDTLQIGVAPTMLPRLRGVVAVLEERPGGDFAVYKMTADWFKKHIDTRQKQHVNMVQCSAIKNSLRVFTTVQASEIRGSGG